MESRRTLRILSIFHLFHNCQEVSFQEITDLMPLSKKTICRDIRFLRQAGLIRTRFDRRCNAFLPLSTEGLRPELPEAPVPRRYMERIIRLCFIMTRVEELEDPIRWYQEQFPQLSARTRQRDFALLNELGYSICYEPAWLDEPGHWVCEDPGTYGLSTFR